jgi:hypothetical protein
MELYTMTSAKQSSSIKPVLNRKGEAITQVKLPEDFTDMLSELSHADGFMDRILLMCDDNLCTVLEEMDIANKNIRGSYGGGKKLHAILDRSKRSFEAVREEVIAYCKKRNINVRQEVVTYSCIDV